MSAPDKWQLGDLAECIEQRRWFNISRPSLCVGPAFGDVLRVVGIRRKGAMAFLLFENGGPWFLASSFRKILPQHDKVQGCTADFSQSLPGCSPRVAS